MNSIFPQVSIGDVCEVGDGAHAKVERQTTGIPYLTSRNIGDGELDLAKVDFISSDDYEELFSKNKKTTRRPQIGDIFIGIIGTFGNAYKYKETDHFGVSSSIGILRPDQSVLEPGFLFYSVRSDYFRENHLAIRGGSAQGYTNIPTVKSLPLILPPLPIQQRIAEILGRLDDKIEVNRRINRTLEQMAQALYKEWFVDFGPIQDGEFVESELGLIPKGWGVKALDEIATYLNGLALQKYPAESDYDYLPVIKIAEMRRGFTESSNRATTKLDPKYVVQDGDVLFSWSGSLEVMIWCNGRGALNQHLFKVTSNVYPKWFYYLSTFHHLPDFRAIAAGKATTMGHIQRGHLSEALVPIPPAEVFQTIHNQMEPLIEKLIVNDIESRQLAATRDYLLPRLLSGALSVADGV